MAELTEAEWQVCDNPPTLRYACRERVDAMRFRWLAVEWGSRVRQFFYSTDLPWFDAYCAWVAGQGDYSNLKDDDFHWDGFGRSATHVKWARDSIRALRHRDDALTAAVYAAMSFAEYIPRPTDQPTDFNHSHRKRSKKAKTDEKARTSDQALRHAVELKAHRERTHWEFCEQFRCVAGNPFRPVAFDPRWRSETAVALAKGIDAERAFDRMPILADALEEAGCDHPDILTHCRGPGPHVRGCWVVDGVLGKI